MKKMFLLVALCSGTVFIASAQTIQENIDKAIKDPKRIENEAKADVYIHHKKSLADSAKKQEIRKERKKIIKKKYKKPK